jgi:hypothetical protein
MKTPNVAASVRQRLLTLAQARRWEFNRVLARYGVERVLWRLAASPHGERFLLKGATLFTVWNGPPQVCPEIQCPRASVRKVRFGG